MAFVRHLAQIAMPTALDEHKLCIGHFFRQHLSRLDVATGAAFVNVLAADDDQGRRLDLVN